MNNKHKSPEDSDIRPSVKGTSDNNVTYSGSTIQNNTKNKESINKKEHAKILCLTSYPPRECGIATYSQDLIIALETKFSKSITIKVCALEVGKNHFKYPKEVKYILNTSEASEYEKLSIAIDKDSEIDMVLVQHEFGFYKSQERAFVQFLYSLTKPIVVVFHTVLSKPNEHILTMVKSIALASESIVVMTNTSANILKNEYNINESQITVIAHGTHLVPHLSKDELKQKYNLSNRKVLTTFGLLSSGKSIETTLKAMPAIIKECPETMFLIIGKTHPEVVKNDGEAYRDALELLAIELNILNNIRFINSYLALPELLEYLQLTDIYLFTTNDPHQAVSGTFAYAMSCACPIISTPIPHAKEVLTTDTGIIFDFQDEKQLANGVISLLSDESLRKSISTNTLQKIVSTAWENSAVSHANLFAKVNSHKAPIVYNNPAINLDHLREMTTHDGMIQFSKINEPDINSGFTLDDNARALIAACMYLNQTGDRSIIHTIEIYISFIEFCQQSGGNFLNYVDKEMRFTAQNEETNLDDANGRAIWALGYTQTVRTLLPNELILQVEKIYNQAIHHIETVTSTRAMAFAIKGLYYDYTSTMRPIDKTIIAKLAFRIEQMYQHESSTNWEWFESYLTYANSILPESMLYAWLLTGDKIYKDISINSLNFLIGQIFNDKGIEVISNKNWLQKGEEQGQFGEQPIDVSYTVMTLNLFYDVFKEDEYHLKMNVAFNWFLGRNRLHQIIYNPCTGGCYDGLEETHVNLNQGAESTVSYLMARLTIEKHQKETGKADYQLLLKEPAAKAKKLAPESAIIPPQLINCQFITNPEGITTIEDKGMTS